MSDLLSSSFQGNLSCDPVDLGDLKRRLSALGVNSCRWRLFLSVYGLLASLADADQLLPEVRVAVAEMQIATFLADRDFPVDLLDDLFF